MSRIRERRGTEILGAWNKLEIGHFIDSGSIFNSWGQISSAVLAAKH